MLWHFTFERSLWKHNPSICKLGVTLSSLCAPWQPSCTLNVFQAQQSGTQHEQKTDILNVISVIFFFLSCHSFAYDCKSLPLPCGHWHIQSNWMDGNGIAVLEPCVPKFIEDREHRREFKATPSPPFASRNPG